jgi:hypothetical protein
MHAAQQDENIKSTKTQQMANVMNRLHCAITSRSIQSAVKAILREAIPPMASMTGPKSNFPKATDIVAMVS